MDDENDISWLTQVPSNDGNGANFDIGDGLFDFEFYQNIVSLEEDAEKHMPFGDGGVEAILLNDELDTL